MDNYRMNCRNNSSRRNGCTAYTGTNHMEMDYMRKSNGGRMSPSCKDNPVSEHTGSSCNKSSSSEYAASSCNKSSSSEHAASSCNNKASEYPVSSSDQIYWGDLPVAMAYIPSQKFCGTYNTAKGLDMGTIFPDLCKPFCGKGGGCH